MQQHSHNWLPTAAVGIKVAERLGYVAEPDVQLLKFLKRYVAAGQGSSGAGCGQRPAMHSAAKAQQRASPRVAHPVPSRSCSRIMACKFIEQRGPGALLSWAAASERQRRRLSAAALVPLPPPLIPSHLHGLQAEVQAAQSQRAL